MSKKRDEPILSADDLCATAREMFLASIQTLKSCLDDLNASDVPQTTDVQKACKAVNDALQTVFKERERLEKFISGEPGLFNGPAIDFEEARREVECRMDRLRAAADTK